MNYNCHECDALFEVTNEMAGCKVECYNCNSKFFFPESFETAAFANQADSSHQAVIDAKSDSAINIKPHEEASAQDLLNILDTSTVDRSTVKKKKKTKKNLPTSKKSKTRSRAAVPKKSKAPLFLCVLIACAGAAFFFLKDNSSLKASLVTSSEAGVDKTEILRDSNGYSLPITAPKTTELKSEFGKVASIMAPPDKPQWELEAEKRINDHRKADLSLKLASSEGHLAGAEVSIELIKHQFHFGGVAHLPTLIQRKRGKKLEPSRVDRDLYKKTFIDMFNAGGLNNGFKPKLKAGFEAYLPQAINWFKENKIHLRGHTLIWPGEDHLSKKILGLMDRPSELKEACIDEVRDYAEKWNVDEWDVINEPRHNHIVMDKIGNEAMVDWFKTARKYAKDPNCKLYINEYQIVSGVKDQFKDKYEEHVQFLLDNGAPIDGMGIQSRIKIRIPPETLMKSLNRLNKFNLAIKATEFEVADTKRKTFSELERAEITHEMLTTYFSHPKVTGFYVWTIFQNGTGPTRAGNKPNHGWTSFMVHNDGRLKRNGLVWKYLTQERWNTNITCKTDAEGELKIRGFKGDYKITIKHQGKTTVKTYRLLEDSTQSFSI